jgi:alkylation response protein AidB-like acyl-CoA dehydrogenase
MNVPTILAHGTEDQKQRWVGPTLMGALSWCQLFSEPDAGSDLAALRTKATRAEGGWLVTGQKVWTSGTQQAHYGFALARTDPSAPKHHGITCMAITMTSPGVTVRPLRQITGEADFNEVFLDGVFVPDKDVIGNVNEGWRVARTTLGNERVSIGDAGWPAKGAVRAIESLIRHRSAVDPCLDALVGRLVAREVAIRATNLCAAVGAMAGVGRGASASIAKLVRAETGQGIADLGIRLLGHNAAFADSDAERVTRYFLAVRAATIGAERRRSFATSSQKAR